MVAGGRTDYDVICFSHLRWDFVYQRPQHLMSRAARGRRVLFVEEPVYEDGIAPTLRLRRSTEGVEIVTPVLAPGGSDDVASAIQGGLLRHLVGRRLPGRYVAWLYTPMALPVAEHLGPELTIYDCMDELSHFKDAPAALGRMEGRLLRQATVVFTGGYSLYRAKRHLHDNIHPFPSAVDFEHFAAARRPLAEPQDQMAIPRPRAGFFGVIDERLDVPLLAGLADLRPELQIIMLGPVVKIDPASLPQRPNLHWLGMRSYSELPAYIAGWDVAMLPFARNEATRFISPTKTPEYLAAGRPVVSTSIRDVVQPYGAQGLVQVADTPAGFAEAIDLACREDRDARLAAADRLIRRMSWDATWDAMDSLILSAQGRLAEVRAEAGPVARPGAASRQARGPVAEAR